MKKWKRGLKRTAAFTLALILAGTTVDMSAFAAEDTRVVSCEHHAEHTGDCGYAEGTAGSACIHEHGEECYTKTVECIHNHDEACGYREAQEGSSCTHQCSEEDDCIIVTENCIHTEHDETCGYTEAVEGTSCNYVCGLCADEILPECTCGTDDDSVHATNCPVYVAPENPACFCAEKCTADTLNVWCDMCGAWGAAACTGEEDALTVFAESTSATPVIKDADRYVAAFGTPIYIEAGTTEGYTVVWYDKNDTKTYLTANGDSGQDLSGYTVYGGAPPFNDAYYPNDSEWNFDWATITATSITMTGGTLTEIVANSYYNYESSASLLITGGTAGRINFSNVASSSSGSNKGSSTGLILIDTEMGITITYFTGIYKDGSNYIARGAAEIPSDFTLTVGADEALSVPQGASLTNNGTIDNNGTITVEGTLANNSTITITHNGMLTVNGTLNNNGTITNNGTINAAYITTDSPGTLSVWVDGSAVNDFTTAYIDGKLYIYKVTGDIKATLNGKDYYGTQTSGSSTELTADYKYTTDIFGIPTEIVANKPVTLDAVLSPELTTFATTVSYSLKDAGDTGAELNDNVLTAYKPGTIEITVTATDGYSPYSEDFDITVKHVPVTGLSGEVPSAMIVGSKITLPTALHSDASYTDIEWSIVQGESETGASITDGVFTATKEGTFTVRATIKNGSNYGIDYIQDFTVKVSAISDRINIGIGSVTISRNTDGKLHVAYPGFSNGYEVYDADEMIFITGTTGENTVFVESGSPNIVLSDCSITSSTTDSPFSIASGAKVNLILNGSNVLKNTKTDDISAAGLSVPQGAEVAISGDGSIEAAGGYAGAGIGGGVYEAGGIITITGGTITATGGGNGGAGIGGGSLGAGGTTTITGGTITATGGRIGGAGIGGGYKGVGGTTTITGGTITATGVEWGAGIGGGTERDGGIVEITGGNVKATASSSGAEAIGKGDGGSSSGTLTNGAANSSKSLKPVTITLAGVSGEVAVDSIDVPAYYGMDDVVTMDGGKLYLYLPDGERPTKITLGNGNVYNGRMSDNALSATFYKIDMSQKPKVDDDGFYLIADVEDLVWFSRYASSVDNTIKGRVTADIDASGSGFASIGIADYPYAGTFDGDYHRITVDINAAENYAALFDYVNGATIQNLIVDGRIATSAKFASGLIGNSAGTTTVKNVISNVVIESSVSGGGIHGGLVGTAADTLVMQNCGFVGEINGSSTYSCGGFIGWADNGTSITIRDSYLAAGFGVYPIDSNTIARNYDNVSVNIMNFYYRNALDVTPDSDGITQKSVEQFKSGEVTYLLNNGTTDGTQVWYQTIAGNDAKAYPQFSGQTVYKVGKCKDTGYSNENAGYTDHSYDNGICSSCGGYQPAVNNGNVYEISNVGQLFWFAQVVNGVCDDGTEQNQYANAKLMQDIDLEGRTWYPIGLYQDPAVNGGKNVQVPYRGTFDGNFHTVSNFIATGNGCQGLIGFATRDVHVKNLGIIGATVQGKYAGAVTGSGGNLENCYAVDCVITGYSTISGEVMVSSVGGNNLANNEIINCFAYNCTLKIDEREASYNIRPVAGAYNNKRVEINNCYYGEISANRDYTSTTGAGAMEKTKAQFESGEVTYLLNGSTSEGDLVWKQTIGTHEHPVFDGQIVYHDTDTDSYHNGHTHQWKYSLNGSNTIKAECTVDDCLNTDGGSVSIAVPDSPTYNGSAIEADVTDTLKTSDAVTIVYTATGGGLTEGKPVNAGSYTASITIEDTDGTEHKASVDFEIKKATPVTVNVSGAAITYGNTLSASTISGTAQHSSSDTTAVSGSFAWKDANVKPTVADSGITAYAVVFTPSDTVNYNTEETTATLTVNKALNVPNMPGSTRNVSNKYEKIGKVPLPDGWEWQETDKETALLVDTPVTATAVYAGADKDNYENVMVQITVTRSACDHVAGDILYTGEDEKAPTCTEDGLGHTECKECGTVMESGIVVKALGHTGGTATCKDRAVCTRCKQPYGSTDGSRHGDTKVRVYRAATCTSGGYTGDSYCEDCGTKLRSGTSTGAKGHDYAGTVTTEPTTETTGIRTYTCSGCGSSYTEVIPELPAEEHKHDYTSSVTKEATCTDCDYTYTESIEKTGSSETDSEEGTGSDIKAPFIKDDEGKEGWDVIRDEVEDAKDGDTVTVDMNGSTVVPGDVFDDIRDRDITIVFDMGNGITWSVNGKDITSDNVGNIDFGVKVGADAEDIIPVEIINKVTGERYYINISLAYDGEFGFKAVMTLNVDAKNAGLIANLFYFNEQTGELEFLCADEIAEDGTAELTFTHASAYTIIIDANAMETPDTDNTQDSPEAPVTSDNMRDASVKWWVIVIGAVILLIGSGVFFVKRKNKDGQDR